MPEYLAPGVYMEEVSNGSVPIEALSTSTAAVIGLTQRGPVNVPTLVTGVGQFREAFGGPLPQALQGSLPAGFSAVWYAVNGFFENGGRRLYVTRVQPGSPTFWSEEYALQTTPAGPSLQVQAIDPGSWANPVDGFVNGRHQQVSGLRIVFGEERVPARSILTGTGTPTPTTTTLLNLSSTAGLYVGAVVRVGGATPELRVVNAVGTGSITVAPALTSVPVPPAALQLQEFSLTVDLLEEGRVVQSETWRDLNVNGGAGVPHFVESSVGKIPPGSGRGIGGSNLIRVAVSGSPNFATDQPLGPKQGTAAASVTPGDDGLSTLLEQDWVDAVVGQDDDDPNLREGMYAFKNLRGLLMIAMPGVTDVAAQAALLALAQNERYKFAVLDPAPVTTPNDWHTTDASVDQVMSQRSGFDSEYGALYYPWLVVPDPFPDDPQNRGNVHLSPSGHVMGIYARSDIERGVHKAPANEVVNAIIDFSRHVDQGSQEVLNPLGINVFRDFRHSNRGLRLWGARTVSSDGQWKYVSIRRLFQFIEASIEYGTQWVVFEPNNELLWARVRQSVSNFLTDTWRTGALMGTKPSEAYYVRCGRQTMTQSDIENGRLIVEIGLAATFPAEFVIFRVSQWTATDQGS